MEARVSRRGFALPHPTTDELGHEKEAPLHTSAPLCGSKAQRPPLRATAGRSGPAQLAKGHDYDLKIDCASGGYGDASITGLGSRRSPATAHKWPGTSLPASGKSTIMWMQQRFEFAAQRCSERISLWRPT